MILRAAEAGEGAPLVLLHGLFGAARNFGAIQRALSHRFRVIALDLRNHGGSPHAPQMDYATTAGDVLETLDLRAAVPAVVMGHSMGGKVAMHLALSQPDAVTRLVVADIAPVAYPPHFQDIANALLKLRLDAPLTRGQADAALGHAVPDDAMRAFLLQNLLPGRKPAWQIGLAEIAAALSDIGDWNPPPGATFTKPTMFVAGERSDYIQVEHRPLIRTLFPAARFITLKGAGHWLHADNPTGFVSLLEAFALA
ncbi:MAG: alpha/beta fold hydrolase [Acetobacteraceae bacterium]|nr:alpha/beta fold hydrolase [Acetobacteraceae bacterium]